MILYGISGLGADKRVFQFLKLNCQLIPLDWIDPMDNETIEQYAQRFAKRIDTSQKFGIIGVSFGGLIATELNKIINPEITFLISSAETKRDLKKWYWLVGQLKVIQFLPLSFFNTPKRLAKRLFGAKNENLLYEILKDTDLKFAKWAVNQLTTWTNKTTIKNCVKIHGNKDKLISPPRDKNYYQIKNGQHFMVVDRADEISELINEKILDITLT